MAERLPQGAYRPLYDEANKIASKDGINVDVWRGPIGSCGFRKGWWPVTRGDESALVYCSVPHGAETHIQREIVLSAAAQAFAIRDLRRAGFREDVP